MEGFELLELAPTDLGADVVLDDVRVRVDRPGLDALSFLLEPPLEVRLGGHAGVGERAHPGVHFELLELLADLSLRSSVHGASLLAALTGVPDRDGSGPPPVLAFEDAALAVRSLTHSSLLAW